MTLCISVCGIKGGVGKTTIAVNVAAALHHAGKRAILVDTDAQRSASSWAARASESGHDGPPVVALDARSLRRDLSRVTSGADVVILDSPARLGAESRAAMLVGDLVLLPTTPGGPDTWALQETLGVFDEARGLREDLRGAVVLNRARTTTLTTLTARALEALSVPVLGAVLRERVVYGEAILAGQDVTSYAPASEAAREIRLLVREILAACSKPAGRSRKERAA